MHLRIRDGQIDYPFQPINLVRENPNVSFSAEMPDSLLAEYGVYPVKETAPPDVTTFETYTQQPPQLIDGVWCQQWKVVKRTPPQKITPRQCRIILAQYGLLASVEQTIAGMDEATRITWEYALEFRRDDPLLNALGEQLKLTAEQIDQFFIAAAAI
jgi:hypothetical protein